MPRPSLLDTVRNTLRAWLGRRPGDDLWRGPRGGRPKSRADAGRPRSGPGQDPAADRPDADARPRPDMRPDPPRLLAPRPGGSARAGLGDVAVGLWRLACGHPDGLGRFNATVAGFLASLVPLLLLQVLMAADGAPDAARGLGSTVVGLLALPVLSHALATRWNRERQWLRYAVVMNWGQWALMIALPALVLVTLAVAGHGSGAVPAQTAVVLLVMAYWLWLNWFVARHALALSRGRAVLLVLLAHLGSGLLIVLPQVARVVLALQ